MGCLYRSDPNYKVNLFNDDMKINIMIRPFLRLAIGVKYEWVDDLLAKTGKIDVNKLIGNKF